MAAILGVGLSAWAAAFLPWDKTGPDPLALPILAVVLLARLSGFGPTLLATVVGLGLLLAPFLNEPLPGWGAATRIGLFVFVGVASACFVRAIDLRRHHEEDADEDAPDETPPIPSDFAAELVTLFRLSEDAIIGMTPEGIITSWNKAAERMFGYLPDEIIGQPITQLIPVAYSHATPEVLERIRQGESIKNYETVRVRKDESLVDVSLGLFPVLDAEGRVSGVATVARDITERKLGERQQAAQHALSRVLADAPTLQQAAPMILKMLGEGLGYPVAVFWVPVQPEGKLRCLAAWHSPSLPVAELVNMLRRLEYEQEGGLPGRVRATRKAAAGSDLTAADDPHLSAAAIVGLRGAIGFPVFRADEVLGVIEFLQPEPTPADPRVLALMAGVGSQIGQFVEREQTEGRLRQTEDQFRQAQKMEAVGQLAGGIAHDFNNLLTGILGYSDLILMELQPEQPHHDEVFEIRKAAERAALLTGQLLAFSRKSVLAPRILDLNFVVADAEKMLHRLIGEDIQLVTTLTPNLGRIKADPGQIEQVLINLVVNARDAMTPGGQLTIATANTDLDGNFADTRPGVAPGRYVRLSVTDTGCGMDATTRARIFEPFFTTKEVGKGTGLGLATVYGIVKQSGGHIEVESQVAQGTAFHVYLPRTEEVAALPKSSQGILLKAPRGSETILLVEDESVVRALARTTLQGCGYEVLEADGAEKAIQHAQQHQGPIHLLLSDVVMPGMGGKRLAERLSSLRPGIKVLFMSGYTDDSVLRHGVREKEVVLLQKPFTPVVLARTVRDRLDELFDYDL